MYELTRIWGRATASVKRAIVPLALYDLLFKIVGALVLTPLSALALERIVATSGSVSITNTDIAAFLISPWGLLFLILTGSFGLASLFAEQAGLMHILVIDHRGRRPDWLATLARILATLPRLLVTAFTQVVLLLLLLAPLAGIGAAAASILLADHDINWFLAERPPQLWAAAGIGVLLAAAGSVLLGVVLVRWSLTVPVCLYEGLSGRAALRRSRTLIRGRQGHAAALVLGWLLLTGAFSALALGLLDLAGGLLLGPIQNQTAEILVTSLILGAMTLTGLVLSFVALAGYAFIVVHLYSDRAGLFERHPGTGSPAPRRRLVPALVLFLVAATGLSALATLDLMDDLTVVRAVAVTAHRGSSVKAPENSLSAIRQAIEDGADYAEIDVQETADGTLVLLHDTDLMRVAGLDRKIWQVTYDEIRALDAGSWFSPAFSGEPIATLRQAIELARGRVKLNIELKFNGHDRRLAQSTAELIRSEGFADQCVMTSLDQSGLRSVRGWAPEIPVGQIVTVAVGDLLSLDVDLLSMQAGLATREQIRANRAAGLQTHVWTINAREEMERMIERGADNIITDQPALLRQVIDARTTRSAGELLLLALSARLKG